MTETSAPTRRALILAWLAANPGYHRPVTVAQGCGVPTHAAANDLTRLAKMGKVLRVKNGNRRNGPAAVLYGAP